MSFLNPTAFLLLLAAIPLALLYWSWRSRQRVEVSHLPLWQEALAERSTWSRWRPLASLSAWLAILTLLVIALADPRLLGGGPPRRVVLVIDATASMNAESEAGTRIDLARTAALELVEGLGSTEEAMVLSIGSAVRLEQRWTNDRAALRAAIENIRPSDGGADPAVAIALARKLVGERPGGTVVLVSDVAFPAATNIAREGQVRLLAVGESSGNIAVAGLAARPAAEDPTNYEVLVRVQAKGIRYPRRQLKLTTPSGDASTVDLEFDDLGRSAWRGELAGGGLLIAELIPPDSLPADDSASLPLPARTQRRAVWHGPAEHAAAAVVRNLPGFELATADSIADEETLHLFLGEPPPELASAQSFLWLEPRGAFQGISAGEAVDLLGYGIETTAGAEQLDLNSAAIERARRLELPQDWEVLAYSGEGVPLVARAKAGPLRAVVNISLGRSDLTQHPVFPELLGMLLTPAGGDAVLEPQPTGFTRQAAEDERVLLDPFGDEAIMPHGTALLETAGVWRVVAKADTNNIEQVLPISIREAREHDLRPLAGSSEVILGPAPLFTLPLWPLLLGLAFLLAILEWTAFSWRITN